VTHDPTDATFAGSVPDAYERHLVPLIFQVYADDLARRVHDHGPGSVLEVAAGTGVATRAMTASLGPSVRITASDLNPAMIDTAMRPRASRLASWCAADALHLPFPDDTFDVVACQFGVMFFPDRIRGYAEVRRVLRPRGVFVFNVWDEIAANDFAAVVNDAVAEVHPEDPPRFMARTPHGYHDTTAIRDDLSTAGFTVPADIEHVEHRSHGATAEEVALAFCRGTPLRNELEQRDPARWDAATDRATQRLRERFGPVDLDGHMAAFVVTAVADGASTAE